MAQKSCDMFVTPYIDEYAHHLVVCESFIQAKPSFAKPWRKKSFFKAFFQAIFTEKRSSWLSGDAALTWSQNILMFYEEL